MIAQPDRPIANGPVIHLDGVEKTFRRGTMQTAVLRGVDLVVQPGECVLLAGPSGSGKTTLLSVLGCILSADAGRVRIFDQEIRQLDDRGRVAFRRERIGFVFQRFQLIRGLTALENVVVPLAIRGVPAAAARRRAMPLLDAVGMTDKAGSHPARLSAGQCQRIALARALVGDPELILADEPTASLDAENGREVMTLLRRLTAEEGKTAVVVTHDSRIFSYADRIILLEDGRVTRSEQMATVAQVAGEDK